MSRYVFNQYYFDMLKKLKDISKDNRKSNTCNAIRKAIKTHYSSYDKLSDEYVMFFKESTKECRDAWDANVTSLEDAKTWLESDLVKSTTLYKGITLGNIDVIMKSKKTLYHYFVLMCIFSQDDLAESDASSVLVQLKNMMTIGSKITLEEYEKQIDAVENEYTKNKLKFLLLLQKSSGLGASGSSASNIDDSIKELESTTLGKLAKEIMEEVDVSDLQKTLSDDGDILKAFSNPEGGLGKLLGTVSQKMISKLASGEIKQETLLQDALKFSGQLKNMMPKEAQGFGDIGNMMSKMGDLSKMMNAMGGGGGDDDDGGFDMSKLAEMMSSLGGKKGGAAGGAKRDTRTAFNTSEMSRVARAKQMRRKLEKRRREQQARKPNQGNDNDVASENVEE